ncbi:hypothetical protein [Streptomyces sp. NBC_01614]|uniref:hypothetical protein n=1 Tax=Streptomyces sp. NBC_01614 TaxID=2975897 RepID=UPI0038636811
MTSLNDQQLNDDRAIQVLSDQGAQCGDCGDQPGDRICPDCERCRGWYVAALRKAGWAPQPEHDALVAEVRRLRDEVAALTEARRLEWVTAHGQTPHTPRLCECGHSHLAHTVPAPHSCFAHGQTCPCEAYRQLPHDEAVAQLKRNQQAAAERAAAEETHADEPADGYGDIAARGWTA